MKTMNIRIMVSKEAYEKAKQKAQRDGVMIARWVGEAVEEKIKKEDGNGKQ